MNNFSSFLDTSGGGVGSNMPRQAPSPNPASQQSNGIPGSSIPMVNGLPSGGQQTDMNHLWTVVQQLSEVLAENRAQTAGIVTSVQQIQARAAQDGTSPTLAQVNGELHASRAAEIANLTTQLSTAQTQLATLSTSNTSLRALTQDYENALTLVLDKLRPYAYTQTQAMLTLHKHYHDLIEKERATSMQLRLEHAEWQAGLGRVAEYARLALRAQNEADLPALRKIRELKNENRVLRALAGWEEASESEADDEEGGEGEKKAGMSPMPGQS
ncbi:hypothetical protein K432DRAFT_378685 [Lepidopterella palustris CBS 459.81]|uniref:Uncharacterized protein n=1 Tax=Lepidopterella palustris CBS 459.81 TaxID=1314670 RepID=A0A8E2JJI2_9PEZI|nr:hypothetical protein K432DRAFT_378685 [Lepidopterella palustris CBS 459.81]